MDNDKSRRGAAHRFPKTLAEANRCLGLATLIHQWSVDSLLRRSNKTTRSCSCGNCAISGPR